MTVDEVIVLLKQESNPDDLDGMARVGIRPDKAFGTKLPAMRKLGKKIGKDHALAQKLWRAGYRETQILASMVEEPDKVTARQMDNWAKDFTYWEICDQCCMNLFHLLPCAKEKTMAWSRQKGEQQKRAGFALMAVIACKDKTANDNVFGDLFPFIQKGAEDERAPVKKAVSWALRNIGKRNLSLNKKAVSLAKEIGKSSSKHAQWVAKDVLKELTDAKQIEKLKKK